MSYPEVEPQRPEEIPEDREAALRSEIAELRRRLDEQHEKSPKDQNHDPIAHPKRPSGKILALLLVLLVAGIAVAFFAGYLPRTKVRSQVDEEAKADSERVPEVTVIPAKQSASVGQLTLPANIQALTEAPILARSDGYLKRRYADIGDRVKAGQLLAEVEAPEIDQQVIQAQANVMQAKAQAEQARASEAQAKVQEDLAKVTASRFGGLLQRGAVSRQENDVYQSQFRAQGNTVQALNRAVAAAEQNIAAAEASLARATQLQSYKQVRAPFAGVITLRNTDTGALISAGQTLLFRVAQTDRLRAYINVPQSEAETIRAGQGATIQIPEFQGRNFEGTVVRTANALDPTSRTLLTEVQIPNPKGVLMPGLYGLVVLQQTLSRPPLLIAGGTLLIGTNGTEVAVVGKDSRVQIRKVVVGRDNGQTIEILSGIEDGDLLINNPGDAVRNGVKVHATRSGAKKNGPGQAAPSDKTPANANNNNRPATKGEQPAK